MNNCIICKKEIYVPKSLIHRKKYCSIRCQHIALKKRINRICLLCKKEFEVVPSNKSGIFCSYSCYHNYLLNKRVVKNCIACGRIFEVIHSRKDKSKYCSINCRDIWLNKYLKDSRILWHCDKCSKITSANTINHSCVNSMKGKNHSLETIKLISKRTKEKMDNVELRRYLSLKQKKSQSNPRIRKLNSDKSGKKTNKIKRPICRHRRRAWIYV